MKIAKSSLFSLQGFFLMSMFVFVDTTALDVPENIAKEKLLGSVCADNEALTIPSLGTHLVTCKASSGTHSFTIRNTPGSEISYWSADGSNCAAIGHGYWDTASYYTNYSIPYPSNTTSSLITVSGAPCKADPCCFVVFCLNPAGCPLSFDFFWEDPTSDAELAEARKFDAIVNAVIGVLAVSIIGCIGYCRYRRTCCFRPKLVSIPSMGEQPMRTSDGTLIVNFK